MVVGDVFDRMIKAQSLQTSYLDGKNQFFFGFG